MTLAPCPFCGEKPRVQVFEICTTIDCQCHGHAYVYDADPAKARDLWNQRAEVKAA